MGGRHAEASKFIGQRWRVPKSSDSIGAQFQKHLRKLENVHRAPLVGDYLYYQQQLVRHSESQLRTFSSPLCWLDFCHFVSIMLWSTIGEARFIIGDAVCRTSLACTEILERPVQCFWSNSLASAQQSTTCSSSTTCPAPTEPEASASRCLHRTAK